MDMLSTDPDEIMLLDDMHDQQAPGRQSGFARGRPVRAPSGPPSQALRMVAGLLAFAALLLRVRPGRPTFGFACLLAFTASVLGDLFLDEGVLALPLNLSETLPDGTGPTLSLTLLAGAWAGRRFLRPAPEPKRGPAPEDLARAAEIVAGQPNASAGLVRLGDKHVLFSDSRETFIMYACHGRSWVALFDPVGPRSEWPALVMKFMDAARADGCRPVFYQVSPEFLPSAVDARLKPYKLGEQAVVDLTRFDLKGGAWLKLRRSINRAERDGLEFAFLQPCEVPAVLDELLSVSRQWLAAHKAGEKGFSLGTFQPAYVAASPVAVVRIEGRIVAFANILTANNGREAFIDLMRHVPGTHRGMMDLLFVRTMERLKANGFSTMNLGMAPLAGLSDHQAAPLWNHIGRRIFRHGERFYNFQGVLSFKSKFDPAWQPRYLAVGGDVPIGSLYDVTMLIGGGLKNMLRR
ncbi:GNAT family N-acetyltransferase [Rhizobium sp. SGZ-381]|uniref:GNAT family N-acetyltransferase n=1 Tax=Rhizobium sp. SGZ-381 TaxID=3342800 RepID=UPI00366F3E0E